MSSRPPAHLVRTGVYLSLLGNRTRIPSISTSSPSLKVIMQEHFKPTTGPRGTLPADDPQVYADMENAIRSFLDPYQPMIDKLAGGDVSLPVWTPNENIEVNAKIRDFIKSLAIPRSRALGGEVPDMLLYRLGRFQQDDDLKRKIQNLLDTELDKVFLNTSGAGKTRMLLEHLCSRWGLYFTCDAQSIVGSRDIITAVQKIQSHPSFEPRPGRSKTSIEKNQAVVDCQLLAVLLARLLVLYRFTSALNRMKVDTREMEHKRNWVYLQLHPDLLDTTDTGGADIFGDLADCITATLIHNRVAEMDAVKMLDRFVSEMMKLLSGHLVHDKKDKLLFISMDECQVAASEMKGAFRSKDMVSERPFLRQLAICFSNAFKESKSMQGRFIFAGSGYDKNIILDALSSAVAKMGIGVKDVTETGAFDDAKAQLGYMEGFFPPRLCQSAEFTRLHRRIFHWLRGRHRFTAEYISVVLQNGYNQMDELLDRYISEIAQFNPTDFTGAHSDIPDEIRFPIRSLNFNLIDERMQNRIKEISYDYLLTSRCTNSYLGSDETDYIERGFARFRRVKEKGVCMTIDEPLVLLACAMWFNHWKQEHTLYRYVAANIRNHRTDSGRNGFEEFICFYLMKVFQKPKKLGEVFTFKGNTQEKLGNKSATLVALNIGEDQSILYEGMFDIFHPKPSLPGPIGLTVGSSLREGDVNMMAEWLSSKKHAAFCFPGNPMGPDIMCFLKLKEAEDRDDDFTYICLAVQCKFYQSVANLTPSTLRDVVNTLTPRNFFALRKSKNDTSDPLAYDRASAQNKVLGALEKMPRKDPCAGRYGIVRVVCGFPVDLDLDKFEENTADGHPLCKLDAQCLIEETKHLSPTDICKNISDMAFEARREKKNWVDDSDEAVLWPEEDVDLDSQGTLVRDLIVNSSRERVKKRPFDDLEDPDDEGSSSVG
ncbi:hypothetical protein D9757_011266 [Collybiopsis confluens]|uniref:Uncharacterized protein n=1 Tax=Collybiopsis confluens TaxID=2823264 RepID=A0A8H5LPN1_9AGAR|nr:hypothetical protein D9757_011266 [Collybiopsis confluens]